MSPPTTRRIDEGDTEGAAKSDAGGDIRLVVVESTSLGAEALAALLGSLGFAVLASTGRGEEALDLVARHKPDILLLDAMFPAAASFGYARQIATRFPEVKIVFLDNEAREARLREALKLAPAGYWTRRNSAEQVAAWLRRVACGEVVFCSEVAERVKATNLGWQIHGRSPFAALTNRERELLPHLARGLSVRQIAMLLERSPSTIDNHKARLMKKLGLHKIAELTRLAIREGFIEQ